jgi:hypothetical protein
MEIRALTVTELIQKLQTIVQTNPIVASLPVQYPEFGQLHNVANVVLCKDCVIIDDEPP